MLINYKDSLQKLKLDLDALWAQSAARPLVINLHGIGGSGKTTLLNTLISSLKEEVNAEKERTHFVWLDMNPLLSEQNPAPIDSGAAFTQRLLGWAHAELAIEIEPAENHMAVLKELAEKIKAYLDNSLRSIVFILDGLIQLEKWFAEIEDNFISAFIGQPVLFILTTRIPARLNRFDLRDGPNIQLISLPPLPLDTKTADDVNYFLATQYPQYNFDKQAGQWLLKITNGYGEVIVWLSANPVIQKFLSDAFNYPPSKLLGEVEEVIYEASFQTVEKYLTVKAARLAKKQEIRNSLKVISIFRRYDVDLLQKLLSWVHNEAGSEKPPIFEDGFSLSKNGDATILFIHLSQDLVNTYWVQWDTQRRGYLIEPRYRRLLEFIFKYEYPELFIQCHSLTSGWYKARLGLAENQPATRAIFYFEMLYHLAQADRKADFYKEIQELTTNKIYTKQFRKALKRLWDDADNPMNEAVEENPIQELKELLPDYTKELERILAGAG